MSSWAGCSVVSVSKEEPFSEPRTTIPIAASPSEEQGREGWAFLTTEEAHLGPALPPSLLQHTWQVNKAEGAKRCFGLASQSWKRT